MYSDRVKQAEKVGAVLIDRQKKAAVLLAPPNPGKLTDDDWALTLRAATEIANELLALGYTVRM